MNKKFINFLNNTQDCDDVYFLISESIYHWAICIINNTLETSEMEKNIMTPIKITKYVDFLKEFIKRKGDYLRIVQFIQELLFISRKKAFISRT